MQRRRFLAAAPIAAATFAAPAIAQGRRELKLVMSWPQNFPGLGTAAARLARRFERATDGRYSIRIFGGGELVHPLKCLDAVQDGTADMYHSADYYHQARGAGFAYFTSVPFGLTAQEMDAWVHHGGGQALWDELSGQFGIKPLLCGNTGSQMGGWFRRPILTVDDFKGLRMRIPGFGGDVVRALGGAPVTLAGAEILPALQAGTIDAVEWVGPYNDLAFGFHKVVRHYQFPGFHEPGSALCLGVARRVFDAMPDSDRAILEACAAAENNVTLAEFNASNAGALQTLVTRHGVVLHEFPDDVFRAIGGAAAAVLDQAARTDALTRRIHDSFTAFRKLAVDWAARSDASYMRKRALAAT